ncbi:MAG TPA: carboxypeptidase regulatory-like domain-containing protein, partial [Candidatus Rifleibacterium sp.]|nr:carboxypeptidase regulatory-like domain-containing protein [Candidatus Rifleibacterium sp.]
MVKNFQVLLALVLSLSLLTAVGCGTKSTLRGTLVGTVVDSQTGIGIAGATVVTSPSTTSAITDINGSFTIADVDPGVYTVTAHASDFNSNSLTVS